MYLLKLFRRRNAIRSAAIACAVTCFADSRYSNAATETVWSNPASTGVWGTMTNWSLGTPQAGWVGDVLRNVNVTYSQTVAVDYLAVQLSGSTTTGVAELTLSTASGTPLLETGSLLLGGSYVTTPYQGTSPMNGIGPGEVAQSAGTVTIDPAGLLAVDPTSSYILSGSGNIVANNEQLAGVFSESGIGFNNVSAGSMLTNTGMYTISGGTSSADLVANNVFYNSSTGVTSTGTYNQSGGTLEGISALNFNFSNNANYIYSGGTFLGTMNNNVGATINIDNATIPFTQGLVNNGRTTVTGGTGTYAGPISGTGVLIFNGATSITLTGTSTFTGLTTVAGGTVILAGPVSANSSGGSINGNVGISASGTLQTNADSQIASTSLVTINGGTLNLNTHAQTIGTLNMTAGHVTQASGQGLGVASGQIIINSGSSSITGGLQASVPLNFNVSSSGSLIVGGNISGYNSATASLVLIGGGLLNISANSILSSIDVQQGIVQISEGGTFGGSNTSVDVEGVGSLGIGSQAVTVGSLIGNGAVGLGTGAMTVNVVNVNNVPVNDIFPGSINGTGTLNKTGNGTLTLTGNDTSTGMTNVSAGTLTVDTAGSIAGTGINVAAGSVANFNGTINSTPNVNDSGTVNFGGNPGTGILVRNISALSIGSNTTPGNGLVNVLPAAVHSNRVLLVTTSVAMSGTSGAWTSRLDLANNDLVVHYGGLGMLTNQIQEGFANGAWNGAGIVSSSAAADSTHLTALGVILNDNGSGMPLYSASSTLGLFDGTAPGINDVLVKYTYYGDANLDGQVDGSDYTRIDNGYVNQLSGWYNGDFNYDGVVNGSDYTLIDNAFNTQGSNLSSSAEISPVAHVTSEIAETGVVPEPGSMGIVVAVGLAALRRRGKKLGERPTRDF